MTPFETRTGLASATFSRALVLGNAHHDAAVLFERTLPLLQPPHSAVRFLERLPRARTRVVSRGEPLSQIARSLQDVGIAVDLERRPPAADEVLLQALSGDFDLIVKAIDVDAYHRRTLEPLDQQLLERAPAAVMLVDCHAPVAVRRILAAVDVAGGPESAGREADPPGPLAADIVRLAGALSRRVEAELHVLHAWNFFGDQVLRLLLPPARIDAQLERAREAALEGVHDVLRATDTTVDEHHLHIVKGAFGEVAPVVIDELGADLIVLGTRGRLRWFGTMVPPHAANLVCATHASLLVLKSTSGETVGRLPARPAPGP